MKTKGTALLCWLCCVFCICGIHRFYVGKVGSGILYLFTLGFFGVGQLIDLFSLGDMVDNANTKKKLNQMIDYSTTTAAANMAAAANNMAATSNNLTQSKTNTDNNKTYCNYDQK